MADMCGLEVDPGPCRASIPAWYFNSQSGRCEAFSYGGCDGNANRFYSEEQCERQCGSFRGQGILSILKNCCRQGVNENNLYAIRYRRLPSSAG